MCSLVVDTVQLTITLLLLAKTHFSKIPVFVTVCTIALSLGASSVEEFPSMRLASTERIIE